MLFRSPTLKDNSYRKEVEGYLIVRLNPPLNQAKKEGKFELNYKKFKKLVSQIRKNEIAKGKINYSISKSSIKNLNGRRSLYVVKKIKKGQKINKFDIWSIRPSFGLHPKYFSKLIGKKAKNSRNFSQCDSLLMSDMCGAHTFPYIEVNNNSSTVEHEATTSKIGENILFYCNQRGISSEEATALIVNGYCKEVLNNLPMEFAVEAQKLLEISLEGSVG